jgi:hypothetical protein
MSNKRKEDIYDVSTYTDKELYDLLDLNNPSDRELEAKIIFMIKKYNNINNSSGERLAQFFTDIYNHFFETDEETEIEVEEENINIEISEGFANIDADPNSQTQTLQLQTTKITQQVNTDPTQPGKSAQAQIGEANIGFIKPLDYAPDQLNPLLNQTIKKIISVDSQYRDDKTSMTTSFSFNLSSPLKDVVSLKLYSVQIPYTWYTISKSYGSNFFYLKGNVPGIVNNPSQDIFIDISAGNYSATELVGAINDSIVGNTAKNITGKATVYSDVSFGNTSISYNSNTSLATINIDITKQYNENSYYLYFDTFTTPNIFDRTGVIIDSSRNQSIPAFLGFNNQIYYLNTLNSGLFVPYNTILGGNNEDFNNKIYSVSSSNKTFTIVQYVGKYNSSTNSIGTYDASDPTNFIFNITLNLDEGSYSRNQIYTELVNQLSNCIYLSNESYIKRINVTDSSNAYYGHSYFELKLKPNRYTTQNLTNSKLCVIFPQEIFASNVNSNPIWTGSKSCFNFPSLINELNLITAETKAVPQTINYTITGSPRILLTCSANHFVSSLNDIVISIAPSPVNSSYTSYQYINAINTGITNATIVSPFLQGPPSPLTYSYTYKQNTTPNYSYSYIDDNDVFNLFLDIKKTFDQTMYSLDLTGTYLSTAFQLGNPSDRKITENDTISISGYISNGSLTILSGQMPKVDLNSVEVKITFDVSGTQYGNEEPYGNILLHKNDSYFSDASVNNNWTVGGNIYVVTETTYTVTSNVFSIPDGNISIKSSIVDVSSTGFSVPGNYIDFSNSYISLANDVSNVYFDNTNYTVKSNNILVGGNTWKVLGNTWYVDTSNNWRVIGNTFLTDTEYWDISNINFTVSTNTTRNIPVSSLDISGNNVHLNGNNFNIYGGNINIVQNNLWDINGTGCALANNALNINCNNLRTIATSTQPLITNLDGMNCFNSRLNITGGNLTATSDQSGNNLNIYGNSGYLFDISGITLTSNNNIYTVTSRLATFYGSTFNVAKTGNLMNIGLANTTINGNIVSMFSDNLFTITKSNYTLKGSRFSVNHSYFGLQDNGVSVIAKNYTLYSNPYSNIVTSDIVITGNVLLSGDRINISGSSWDISGDVIQYLNKAINNDQYNTYTNIYLVTGNVQFTGNNFVLPQNPTLLSYTSPNTYSITTIGNVTTGDTMTIESTLTQIVSLGMRIDISNAVINSSDKIYMVATGIDEKNALVSSFVIDASYINLNNIGKILTFYGNSLSRSIQNRIGFNYVGYWYLSGTNFILISDTGLTITNPDSRFVTSGYNIQINNNATGNLYINNNSSITFNNITYAINGTINYITGSNMLLYSVSSNFTVYLGSFTVRGNVISIDNVLNAPTGGSGIGILYLNYVGNTFTLNGNTIITPNNYNFTIDTSNTDISYNLTATNITINGNNLSVKNNISSVQGNLTGSDSSVQISSSSNITSTNISYLIGNTASVIGTINNTGSLLRITNDGGTGASNLYNSGYNPYSIGTTFNLTAVGNINNLTNNALNVTGNLIVTNNNDIFNASYNTNDYPLNNFLLNSPSFYVSNNDSINNLTLSANSFDAMNTKMHLIGNLLTVSPLNTSYSINGNNLTVYDASFQISDASFTLPSNNFVIPGNTMTVNGKTLNVIGNSFSTLSDQITIKTSPNSIVSYDFSSTRIYNIYSNDYSTPYNSIDFSNNANGAITWHPINTSFDINYTVELTSNIVVKGNNLQINSKGNSDYLINSTLLTVSADTLTVKNGGNITYVGRQYKLVQIPLNLGTSKTPYDFSINVIYNLAYLPLTNLISRGSLLEPIYSIPPGVPLMKIYPRFPRSIPTFGNEKDVSYNIINNSGNYIVANTLTDLVNSINALFQNFRDDNNNNILSGSTINLNLNTSDPNSLTVDCSLNIIMNKILTNKDYAITFSNYVDKFGVKQETWNTDLLIDPVYVDKSYDLINNYDLSSININTLINEVYVTGTKPIETISILLDNNNNTLRFIAYENGTISNDVKITVPIYTSDGTTQIAYSRNVLIKTINTLLSSTIAAGTTFETYTNSSNITYVTLRPNINLIYTPNNYNLVFYDTISFVKCYVGATSVKNTTWDSTVGWILGFRNNSEYDLSQYTLGKNGITITGDTGVCTNLFNYFLLCIDDYTQNHLNDGLVTVTTTETSIPLPSYADRTNFTCNPTTGTLTYNNNLNNTNNSKLTQNQLYSLTQIANSQTSTSSNLTKGVSNSSFGTGPYVQDIFGLIPMKTSGLQPGSSYVEFGGTLQNQERVYFGPVNIHRMTVKLVTDRGDVVDLNDVNWSFSLLCEQLYKKRPSSNK